MQCITLFSSFEFLQPSSFFCFFQSDIPKAMRQGMDDLLQYEKKSEEDMRRVYTYEKAAERCFTIFFLIPSLNIHSNWTLPSLADVN